MGAPYLFLKQFSKQQQLNFVSLILLLRHVGAILSIANFIFLIFYIVQLVQEIPHTFFPSL